MNKCEICKEPGANHSDTGSGYLCEECHLENHECNEDKSVDCDICSSCKEHSGFCTVCDQSSCCGAA